MPVSDDQLRALDQLLLGGIPAYERSQADLAGELFQKIGARRKNRLDTMIAAAAILAGANLATVNQTDFEPFRAFETMEQKNLTQSRKGAKIRRPGASVCQAATEGESLIPDPKDEKSADCADYTDLGG